MEILVDHWYVKQTEAQHCMELFLVSNTIVIGLCQMWSMECMEMFIIISKMKLKNSLENSKILALQMSMAMVTECVMGIWMTLNTVSKVESLTSAKFFVPIQLCRLFEINDCKN